MKGEAGVILFPKVGATYFYATDILYGTYGVVEALVKQRGGLFENSHKIHTRFVVEFDLPSVFWHEEDEVSRRELFRTRSRAERQAARLQKRAWNRRK